jgi:(1->4)-alpha-D-glucan 1-alpha-D-glucosylmutase
MTEHSARIHPASPPHWPTATYRWQFNHQFTFAQAAALVDYLHELGLSNVYASPLTRARAGSLHGYDVVDPTRLNPELGSREAFNEFTARLKQHGMGLVLDVVPNHMCIAGAENEWWNDVLENGPSSVYARYFDIDWQPPKQNLQNKVLLPILGDQYGRVLENQQLQLGYQRGAFFVKYYETKLPIAPRSSSLLLQAVCNQLSQHLSEDDPQRLELESILTALSHLPPRTETDPEKIRERRREKEVIKRRLSALVSASREVRRKLLRVIEEWNGKPGDPHSFDHLEELLAEQAYRLCYWRVAADEINYRRFFDVNELAAIRIEEPEVFNAVHELALRLVREGHVTGLRIDHIDGLRDPAQYLRALQRNCAKALKHAAPRPTNGTLACYVVVEKILGADEHLHETWATAGTTGYDFLNLLNGVFVARHNERPFRQIWERLTGERARFADVVYESKKLILSTAMSSELHVLARRLDRVSEQHRYSRDFTLNSLQDALGEVIACFPVYRSYVLNNGNDPTISEEDRRHIALAVRRAQRRNPTISPTTFDFIRSLLLLEEPEGLNDEQRAERRDFVLRFQQLTGPVTAKGVEDTSFYRYYPLASLCEVGGEPSRFGISLETFHTANQYRLAHWPHSMLATSTHDTKRSEDVRARLNVLSEIPGRWYRAVRRWERLNRELKPLVDEASAPDAREEYLLYQTLLGAWPLSGGVDEQFIQRMQDYMRKALREAKLHSSWLSPQEEYEQAVNTFIERLLAPESAFLTDFVEFQAPLTRAGLFNSLAQTLLKITAPGVPDFYQGTEVWDLSLVDPDNRHPVDYAHRQALLAALRAQTLEQVLRQPENGGPKLWLTSRALNFRRQQRELFERGAYLPLAAQGERAQQVIAFARQREGQTVLAVTGRFFTQLPDPGAGEAWSDTTLILPEGSVNCFHDVLTDRSVCAQPQGNASVLPLAEVFAQWPLALLEAQA